MVRRPIACTATRTIQTALGAPVRGVPLVQTATPGLETHAPLPIYFAEYNLISLTDLMKPLRPLA